MSCPTCDHTMQVISNTVRPDDLKRWWCPRCGTLKMSIGKREPVDIPTNRDDLARHARNLAQYVLVRGMHDVYEIAKRVLELTKERKA